MRIGIDGSRAFMEKRTGIGEYSYQVIKHLRHQLKKEEVFLYIRSGQNIDFEIPKNWKLKKLWFPRFWTQIRLSLSIFLDSIDTLFIPAHTVPILHPKRTIVVIHGLEYEFCPEAYSWMERIYMRFVIKNSCRWASDVVCVSENTKKDVVDLYGISPEKISVVYEGYDENSALMKKGIQEKSKDCGFLELGRFILFIGRIERRKNIIGIVESFDLIKEKYGIEHKLVLVGRPGYGYEEIKLRIGKSKFREDIIELGYVEKKKKDEIMKCADVFVFPSFYEGFGLPILEAQRAFTPVVTSNVSSIPEVAGKAALYCNPEDHASIAENIYIMLRNNNAREDVVRMGYENLKRFSWFKSGEELANIIRK